MAKTTQDDRTISIMTTLGKDYFLLEKVHAEERISELFEIDVELLFDEEMDDAFDITVIEDTSVIGQSATVTINQEDSGERSLTGMFIDFTMVGRGRRYTHYFAKIVPHIWKLTQNFQSRIFQHKTVPDILSEVFEGFKFEKQLQNEYKPRNYCVQYQESDFDFASRLMEEEGIYYYFEHKPEAEKMILRDDFKSPEDCPNKSDIPFFNEDLVSEWFESAIKSWQVAYKLRSGKVSLWDYHFQLPTKHLEVEKTSVFSAGGIKQLEAYTHPGGYARKYDDIDKSGGERSDVNNIFQDNVRTAKNRMLMHDAGYKTIAGQSDCSTMTPGYRFQLKNHPNKEFNIKYIVLSVTHDVEQSPGYMSSDVVPKDYRNEFTCIPHGSGYPEFRSPLKTPKPILHGSQTAVVVGPAGEEIFTDKYGRVKVQFHWDREGKYNSDSSCWLRVAQAWAGNRWGMMFIPRIGMEVIVQYLDGDPDQPIIVGSVYNFNAMPPYILPDEKTKMTIKSDSSKGGGGFNELRFEDKKGSEQVFIHGEKNIDERIKNDSLEWVGRDRHLIIKRDQFEKVHRDQHLQIIGDKNEKLGGAMSLTVGTDFEEKVGAKYAVQAGTEIHLKSGTNLTLETGVNLTLKVGGNFISINAGGIFISGTMVMINSGGAAGSGSGASPDIPSDPKEADKAEPGQRIPLPLPLPPVQRPLFYSPAAIVMFNAAQNGTPFCEICSRHASP